MQYNTTCGFHWFLNIQSGQVLVVLDYSPSTSLQSGSWLFTEHKSLQSSVPLFGCDHIFVTVQMPSIWKHAAMTLAVASQSNRRSILTFSTAPKNNNINTGTYTTCKYFVRKVSGTLYEAFQSRFITCLTRLQPHKLHVPTCSVPFAFLVLKIIWTSGWQAKHSVQVLNSMFLLTEARRWSHNLLTITFDTQLQSKG